MIVDIASNNICKNNKLLLKLFNLFQFKAKPIFNNRQKEGDPKVQIFYSKKMIKLGWSQKISMSKGLKDYVKWFKNYKKINVAFIVSSNSAWLGEQNYFSSLLGSINELDDRNFNFYILLVLMRDFLYKKNIKN